MRKLLLIILISFWGTVFFLGSYILIKPKIMDVIVPTQVSESFLPQKPKENKTATIVLVGDIMLDRGVEYMVNKEGGGDFKFPFLKIADYLKNVDIIFGNLEGPISDKGTKVGSIYSFRADPKAIEGLTFAGFNVLSVANNHVFDYSRTALEDTFKRLNDSGIDYTGGGFNENEAYSPVIKEVDGTKIAFLAYTDAGSEYWKATKENSGIAWVNSNNLEKIKNDIQQAKGQGDILIVSLHSGNEYAQNPTQFQTEFSKMAIDAGADIVVGHHPHVVQPNGKYKDGYIFYSLGNFIFDQSFSEETMEGEIIKVVVENKKIKSVDPVAIQINEYFQPEIKKEILSKISLSSENLEQGDTLLIKVESESNLKEISGEFEGNEISFLKPSGSKNWIAILGIDAKKKPGQYDLIIDFPDGSKIKKMVNVIKRNFPVTQLVVTKELEEKGYTPSKIAENITTKENLILNKALSVFTPKAYFDKSFVYPLDKIKDVGSFGNIRKSGDISLQHLGVDLEADTGTPVYAINDGVVRLSQELTDYGKTLIIDHGLGIFSLYLHLNEFKKKEGETVKRGEIIALSGNTGYSIGPHLHFSMKANSASIDPLRFIEVTEKEIIE